MVNKDNSIRRHYFDWAASAPIACADYSSLFGNPSSQHSEGRAAKLALEDARRRCAVVLNVPVDTLYFTSGGTESNSIALFANLVKKGQGRIISSPAEHSSVREAMQTLEKMGKPTGSVSVDSYGRVTAENFAKALEKYGDARFASVMAVNNETGAVTDIASLRDVIRKNPSPVHLHCDLVQAVGKIPVDIQNWGIDSASISAHKISGPRGIGLLYLRRPMEVFYTGGGQEGGIRGGTENTQGALSLADCLEKYCGAETVQAEYARAKERWNKLITSLVKMERCTIIPAHRAKTENEDAFSPYILQVAFKDIPGEVMARALDDLGFAVSTGSACSSSSPERPVLLAMGIDEKLRLEGIRISQGRQTTDEQIDLLLEAIAEVLKFL
ncbi:MAG: aminotransferase class V-fold PLP-dependent enzyme [Treponema sp.]|jgi:cysteine desulfurase|nr:aminotransferase class V-fold PLP-dependent enzyme [Treponema sp.]